MKRILKILVFGLSLCFANEQAHSQTYQLQIDSIVGIPDTIQNGQEVTFYMIVSINTPLFYQGDIFLELEYNGGFYMVDSTNVANASLSPTSPNTVQATHIFTTDNDLSIGDNVVVVWPRIGNGIDPSQTVVNPETIVIHLVEPNGIDNGVQARQRKLFYPNPAHSTIILMDDLRLDVSTVKILDAFGRVVKAKSSVKQMDVSNLPNGVYFIQAETKDGSFFSDKLIISR